MSIVEKAVEKLKTRQPEPAPPAPPGVAPSPSSTTSTVERAQQRERERVRTVDPVEPAAPPWHVDLEMLKRAGVFPAEEEAERRLADELRRVKRPLLNNAGQRGSKRPAHAERIVVTSAVPREGKTFTSLNLALSLAREPDFEVLLVDGDIPKAHITESFGLQDKPGLMDVLVDTERRPADVVVRTDVPNLLVVPTGERHPLTAELFGGRRMEHVLDAWGNRDRQRLLLFDSSPLLATSESQALVSHMGQVVLVVAAGHTRRRELRTAMECFSPEQYVGLVLNMSRLPPSESHYYDDYYGHYYSASRHGGK